MKYTALHSSRRCLLVRIAALGPLTVLNPALAQVLLKTPRQSRGPFYPAKLLLDDDNDLVQVKGQPQPAKGTVTHICGHVLDMTGRPLRRSSVRIWQCNAFGRYHHPRDRRDMPLDPGFQSTGHFVTGDDGAYRFRTIKPVPYPGRTPHIHFEVSGAGFNPITTQMYVAGEPDNKRDGLLNSIRDEASRKSVIVDLNPSQQLNNELAGEFDIVVGDMPG
ncbi:MAG: protocatechuate 3,4-dioxygenase [Gammaproteobacteria bacterium]|nr:protocatechuate 3,4-dioxygenase [Gammaproteobacteria bacterium]